MEKDEKKLRQKDYNRKAYLKRIGKKEEEVDVIRGIHLDVKMIILKIQKVIDILSGVPSMPEPQPFPAPRGEIAAKPAVDAVKPPKAIKPLPAVKFAPEPSTPPQSTPSAPLDAAKDVLDGFLNVNPTTRTDLNEMCEKYPKLVFNDVVKAVNEIAKTPEGKQMIAEENWRGFRRALFEAGFKVYGPQS